MTAADIALRAVLLAGMLAHKALWEKLKSGRRRAKPRPAIALFKIAFLAGLLLQTLLPPVLPISEDPRWLQIVGLALYLLGLAVAMIGRNQLGENWSDIENRDDPIDRKLVEHGIYRFVRHPIYAGDLLLILGLELVLNSWLVLGMLALTPTVIFMALQEEARLKDALPGYPDYCQRTWRFVPFIV